MSIYNFIAKDGTITGEYCEADYDHQLTARRDGTWVTQKHMNQLILDGIARYPRLHIGEPAPNVNVGPYSRRPMPHPDQGSW